MMNTMPALEEVPEGSRQRDSGLEARAKRQGFHVRLGPKFATVTAQLMVCLQRLLSERRHSASHRISDMPISVLQWPLFDRKPPCQALSSP